MLHISCGLEYNQGTFMPSKTYINIEGKSYLVELTDQQVFANDDDINSGLLFRIINNEGEVIGCLSAFLSHTTRAIWRTPESISTETLEKLFLRIIPHIKFESTLEDFTSIYPQAIKLVLNMSDTSYDQNTKKQIVRSHGSPDALVRELVYGGEIDDDAVEVDVMRYLYDKHLDDTNNIIQIEDMAKDLFLDSRTLLRVSKYLYDMGLIEAANMSSGFDYLNVTTHGARTVRHNFKEVHAGAGVIILGNVKIGNDTMTHVTGDENYTNVNSTVVNSFNKTEIDAKFDELKNAIEQHYEGDDKSDLLTEVDEVKTLASDKDKYPEIQGRLGGILSKGANVAQIASLVIQLLPVFGIKIT